jgi:hypothetical protein
MSTPKRHHYLAESYLEPFTRNGFLWIYDRRQQQYRHEQPKNTTVRSHYYSLTDEDGKKDVRVEQALSVIEGLAKQVVNKIFNGAPLTPRDRFRLSLHLGLLYCRGPRYQRAVNELITGHARDLLLRNLTDPVASKHFTNPESEAEYVRSDQFKLELNRNGRIQEMLRQGKEIGGELFCRRWRVVKAPPGAHFVTCDVPFGIIKTTTSPEPLAILGADVIAAVPLSPEVCLLIMGPAATEPSLDVTQLNLAVLRETEDYALARSREDLEPLVIIARLDDPARRPRMMVKEFPSPDGDPMKSISVSYRQDP